MLSKVIYNAAALVHVSIVEITETGIYQTVFQIQALEKNILPCEPKSESLIDTFALFKEVLSYMFL